jgi:hypothetical protein
MLRKELARCFISGPICFMNRSQRETPSLPKKHGEVVLHAKSR